MITLYHGSPYCVEHPLVNVGRTVLDFGPGFYLTRLRHQAVEWALRIKSRKQPGVPPEAWLNTYRFDLDAALADGHRLLTFEAYDLRWLHFIAASRRDQSPWAPYDLIEGGVANDRVIDAIEAYIEGIIDADAALGRLAYARPNHQLCLRSQSLADRYLHHVSSQPITPELEAEAQAEAAAQAEAEAQAAAQAETEAQAQAPAKAEKGGAPC